MNVYETGMPLLRMETPQIEHNNILVHTSNSSTPPKLIFYEDGNGKFVFSDNDNCCFFMESQRKDRRMKGPTQPSWPFTHATGLQFFGELGVSREEGVWERLKKSTG